MFSQNQPQGAQITGMFGGQGQAATSLFGAKPLSTGAAIG